MPRRIVALGLSGLTALCAPGLGCSGTPDTASTGRVEAGAEVAAAQPAKPAEPRSVPAMKIVAPTPKTLTTPTVVGDEDLARKGAAADLAGLLETYETSKLGYAERAAAIAPGLRALADHYPGTDEALTAKLRLLGFTWWEREAGTMNDSAAAITDEVFREYFASKRMAELTNYSYVFNQAQRQQYFGQLAGSPHAEVRAAAEFELARSDLRSKDDAALRAAHERLERLRADYGTLAYRHTTYGEIATAHLEPHSADTLAIGALAPEIVGKDHRGKSMKLSDYRGKVVVLDFWGDW